MLLKTWLGFQPTQNQDDKTKTGEIPKAAPYLITGGVSIYASHNNGLIPLTIEAGSRVALVGKDTYRKHYFCDWIMGFVDFAGGKVQMTVGEKTVESAKDRTQLGAVLGRSPLLYGENLQETLLYRTQNVRKKELYQLIHRLYGESLKARSNPESPLFDRENKPIETASLTTGEHLEIAQINLILQRLPLVVLDLSSELMTEALALGFKPSAELLESGKTIVAILPPGKDVAWAEQMLGCKFSSSMRFD